MAGKSDPLEGVPEPQEFPLDRDGWAAIIDGVGGTGVVTIGAILGMAAHLEGKGCGMIDMAGLAQKGGAVFTHVRIAPTSPEDIQRHPRLRRQGRPHPRLRPGRLRHQEGAAAVREGHTIFVANTAEIMPGDFTRSADFSLPTERLKRAIRAAAGDANAHFFDATQTAAALFGNSLGANMFMLGFACQHGGLPLGGASRGEGDRAQRRGGGDERRGVPLGPPRRARAGLPCATSSSDGRVVALRSCRRRSTRSIARRVAFLDRLPERRLCGALSPTASPRCAPPRRSAVPGSTALAEAAARNLFKLMAIKDEYEVARLYTDGSFQRQLSAQFQSYDRLEFHLAPPILGRKGTDGKAKKSSFGPWMMRGFKVLAALRGLRGTPFRPVRLH